MVRVELEKSTLSVLLAGLYIHYSGIDPIAVPQFLWLEIADKLIPYLEKWDYDKLSLEEWLQYNLLIIPKELVDDVDELKKNDWYFERENGNIVLIVTANMEGVDT